MHLHVWITYYNYSPKNVYEKRVAIYLDISRHSCIFSLLPIASLSSIYSSIEVLPSKSCIRDVETYLCMVKYPFMDVIFYVELSYWDIRYMYKVLCLRYILPYLETRKCLFCLNWINPATHHRVLPLRNYLNVCEGCRLVTVSGEQLLSWRSYFLFYSFT